MLKLVRADIELFEALKTQWDEYLAARPEHGAYYEPYMEHARQIASESPPDPKYGIYALVELDDDNKPLRYEGFTHLNHKLPRTSAAELRMVWLTLSPMYLAGDTDIARVAEIIVSFLIQGVHLSLTEMVSNGVKVYCKSEADRRLGKMLAEELDWNREPELRWEVSYRGGWLQLSVSKGAP